MRCMTACSRCEGRWCEVCASRAARHGTRSAHLQDGGAGVGGLPSPRQRCPQRRLRAQRVYRQLPLLAAGKGKECAGTAPCWQGGQVLQLLGRVGEEDLQAGQGGAGPAPGKNEQVWRPEGCRVAALGACVPAPPGSQPSRGCWRCSTSLRFATCCRRRVRPVGRAPPQEPAQEATPSRPTPGPTSSAKSRSELRLRAAAATPASGCEQAGADPLMLCSGWK